MTMVRALLVLFLCSAAARADELESLIDRPVTLPNGAVDLTLHGTYTNWANAYGLGSSLDGETLAVGIDFGVTDAVQVGLGLALPINPGAGFGSVFAGALFSGDPRFAMRVDFGFESIGFNGDTPPGATHTDRYFGGFGAVIKVPIMPTVAFVT